jgi:lysyl-tRNA synthetase, class II
MELKDQSEQVQVRFEKLSKLRAQTSWPYKNGYSPECLAMQLHQTFDSKTKEELEVLNRLTSLAGRIMTIRVFGKASFVTIQDRSGLFQLYVQKEKLGEEAYAAFREMDIGDILFSEGTLFKTKMGELSLHCETLTLLSKSLRPLPEKYHGLADVEIKYRQRYLDLIMSAETRETFLKRFRIIEEIRRFFIEHEFLEVETPMMHPIAGGATARPFVTHHHSLDMDLFLRIAPELYLKRLVVGGFERVFEINRNFRNEGMSIKHNPEFTMLEFYQSYATYEDLILLTQKLFQKIADRVLGSRLLSYQGAEINLDGSWERIRVEEAILKYSNFKDRAGLRQRETLLNYGKSKGYITDDKRDDKKSAGELQAIIFDAEVESQLIQPTFVTHYPLAISPLSRQNEQDPFLVDRFELFIFGREIANAFSELNDPIEQRKRFLAQMEFKPSDDPESSRLDEDFINALEYGMPPTAGEGIGIDRLVMLFTNSPSIRDVILFPQMRPQT